MSGHSKWNNIKRKKGASDAAKAKVFTKVAREMSVAVKEGGADPDTNFFLSNAIGSFAEYSKYSKLLIFTSPNPDLSN